MTGEVDYICFIAGKAKRWDIAAGEAIITALGGKSVGTDGELYEYSRFV